MLIGRCTAAARPPAHSTNIHNSNVHASRSCGHCGCAPGGEDSRARPAAGDHTAHGSRSASTCLGARRAGGSEPPWTDRDHVVTGAPKATTDRGDPWSTQPTNSIRIEPSLRLSPEADALGLTRGDFRHFLADGESAENRVWPTGRAGHRAGAGGWLEAARVGGVGRPEIPGGWCGDGDA
jgi:hypothetical protein